MWNSCSGDGHSKQMNRKPGDAVNPVLGAQEKWMAAGIELEASDSWVRELLSQSFPHPHRLLHRYMCHKFRKGYKVFEL